jgi:hypothetical protein
VCSSLAISRTISILTSLLVHCNRFIAKRNPNARCTKNGPNQTETGQIMRAKNILLQSFHLACLVAIRCIVEFSQSRLCPLSAGLPAFPFETAPMDSPTLQTPSPTFLQFVSSKNRICSQNHLKDSFFAHSNATTFLR